MRLGTMVAGAALAVLCGCGAAPEITPDTTTVSTEEQFAACVGNEDPHGFSGLPGCFIGEDDCGQYCPGTHTTQNDRMYFGCSPSLTTSWQPQGGSCSIAHTAGSTTYWCCDRWEQVTLVQVPK